MIRLIKYDSTMKITDVAHSIRKDLGYIPTTPVNAVYTEKIHGTNASVCFNEIDGLWVQSRNSIIEVGNDNYGCASFVKERKREFMDIVNKLAEKYNINLLRETIVIYFEFTGGNIQQQSACSGMTKRAILFNMFEVFDEKGRVGYFNNDTSPNESANIYNNLERKIVTIDFNNIETTYEKLMDIVLKLEENSEIGSKMGVDGNTGEGIIVELYLDGKYYKFKVKGEKHSKTSIKKIKLQKDDNPLAIAFAEKHTRIRLEQCWSETIGENVPSNKDIGNFLKWINSDINKEEQNELAKNSLEMKDVSRYIVEISKTWFFEKLLIK